MEAEINKINFDTSLKTNAQIAEHIYETIRDNNTLCNMNYECKNVAHAYKNILINQYKYVETDKNGIHIIEMMDPIGDYHYLVALPTPDKNVTIYYAYTSRQKITKFTVSESEYNEAIEFFKTFKSHNSVINNFNELYRDTVKGKELRREIYFLLKKYVLSDDTVKPIIQDDNIENIKIQTNFIQFVHNFYKSFNVLVNKSLFELYEQNVEESAGQDSMRRISIFDFVDVLEAKIMSSVDLKQTHYDVEKGGNKRKLTRKKHIKRKTIKRKTKPKKHSRK